MSVHFSTGQWGWAFGALWGILCTTLFRVGSDDRGGWWAIELVLLMVAGMLQVRSLKE